MSLGATKRAVELADLMVRLRAIEKEMPQQGDKERGAESGAGRPSDPFLASKSEFLGKLSTVKNSLKELRESRGVTRTRDQIAKAQQVRTLLQEASKLFSGMEAWYNKEMKKKRSKVGQEELATRKQFLAQFKRDLQVLKKLSSSAFTGGTVGGADAEALQDIEAHGRGDSKAFAAQFEQQTQGSKNGGAGRDRPKEVELTQMQQQSLEQIRERDKGFDDLLDQIGEAVDAAGRKARAIKDETELQNVMLDSLEQNIEKTQHMMNTVNVSMKKNLEDRGMGAERFCINCMCFVLLLGMVGVIVNAAG